MLIAVASKDGLEIDQHFGHAERFLVYEVEGNDVRLVAEKKVTRYCSFDPEHPLREHIIRELAVSLDGCRAVVSAQMGEHPRAALEQAGIEAFMATGPVDDVLIELAKVL